MEMKNFKGTELTDEQYEAAADTNNEVLCLACAGSGKSRTLAFRIVRLLLEGASPESIIAFTFTEKAAESIKRRVANALEKANLPPALVGAMYIGTIHSYCQHFLGELDATNLQFEVLDENGFKLFLLSRFSDLGLRDLREARNTRMFLTIDEVSKAWNVVNDEMINLNEILSEDHHLGTTLIALDNKLREDQYVDFSSMIRRTVEALTQGGPNVEKALGKSLHLMVDEYQDVNPSQERLISSLYTHMESLFVVGDDDQSIYGWRGADVSNIVEFDQRYPNCSRHTLSTNFRSTGAIVGASDKFIQLELSTNRIYKEPKSNSEGNINHFGSYWFEARTDEAAWVAKRISDLVGTTYVEDNGTERGLSLSDFAILMRSVQGGRQGNNGVNHKDFTEALTNSSISYLIEGEASVFERDHARVMRDTMELLRDPGISRDGAKAFFDTEIIPVFPEANLKDFYSILSNWNSAIHIAPGGTRRKVYPQMLVHELMAAYNVTATDFENKAQVMRDLGVFSSIILDIEKVFVSIDSSFRYGSILNFLSNVAESGYDTSQVEILDRPNAVTISTVHKMKGLEFPVVFLVDLVNQRFPMNKKRYNGWLPETLMKPATDKGLYQTTKDGESRLFYTAMTRAERFLYLSGSKKIGTLKTDKKISSFKARVNSLDVPGMSTSPEELPDNIQRQTPRQRVDEKAVPTSFTEIKDYLVCPMKYKFSKIYGFCPAVPELFGYGLTTHTAINRLHQKYESTPPTPIQAEQVAEDVFHLKHVFPSREEGALGPFERARNASKELVAQYAKDYPNDFLQRRALEQRFEIKAGTALITGAIDLLLKEDDNGTILEAKVIDFKSMDFPIPSKQNLFWINLALQVQLYAYAADIVLGENAKTGAVHLLRADTGQQVNRVDIPIDDESLSAAVQNIEWAVNKVLENDFPMRPSESKCSDCDFSTFCVKQREEFATEDLPPEISIPLGQDIIKTRAGAFSEVD